MTRILHSISSISPSSLRKMLLTKLQCLRYPQLASHCLATAKRFASSSPPMTSHSAATVGFIGLGSMGWWLSKNVHDYKNTHKCKVWNRSKSKSDDHSKMFGTEVVSDFSSFSDCDIIFSCLSTSTAVEEMVLSVAPVLSPQTIWIDSTSGDPVITLRMADMLAKSQVEMVDAPVSGGPTGAEKKTLSVMVGASSEDIFNRVEPFLQSFAKQVTHVGPVGAGHAIKSINNILNVTQLMLASEGLAALTNMGIDPARALQAINGSSGRSLMTQERIPIDVLTRRFEYGFKLGLMSKDVTIANSVLDAYYPDARLMRLAQQMITQSVSEIGHSADYTEVVKSIERLAGTEITTAAAKTALESSRTKPS